MKRILQVLVICGLMVMAVPCFVSAIDLSKGIILDVPEEKLESQFGKIPMSQLTREDSIAIASYRFTADTLKVLAIMVEWDNRLGTYSKETFDSLLFSRDFLPGGSVADYFHEVSYGQVAIVGEVINWYNAGWYTGWFDFEPLFEELDPVIDYSQFDGNNDGDVDAAVFIRSGNGEEDSQDPNDIWSYAYVYPPGSGPGPFDGMYIPRWNTSPETQPLHDSLYPPGFTGEDTLNKIRVFCHELTHCFGLPDLYDYDDKLDTTTYFTPGDYNDHPFVDWCLMGYYGYGYLSIGSQVPSHLCGWSKKEMGWIDPIVLTAGTYNDLVIYNIETTNDSSLYLLPITPAEGEYFLLEYRNPGSTAKFDKIDSDFSCYFWPALTYGGDSLDRGLLITHVHDSLGADWWRINNGTPDHPHYTVVVEDAGYNPSTDAYSNPEGWVTDSAQWWYPYETRKAAPFSHDVSGQEIFSPSTYPNSDGYFGPSGIVVRVDSIVDDKLYAYIHIPSGTCGISVQLLDPTDWCNPPLKVSPDPGFRVITLRVEGLIGGMGGDYQVTSDHPKVSCVSNCTGYLASGESREVEMLIDCQGTEEFINANVLVHGCIGTSNDTTVGLKLHAVCGGDYYECPRDPATYIEKDNSKLKAKFWANCEQRVWDKRIYPEDKQQVIFTASSIVPTTWQGDTIVGRQDYSDILTGARDTINHVVGIDPAQPECALQVVWVHNTFICANNLPPPNHQRWWWIDIHKQIFMWHDTLGMECPNWKKEQIIKQIWITKSQYPVWWPEAGLGYQEYEDIYFGFFADIDAPSDISCHYCNTAAYDYGREIMWQHGYSDGTHPEYEDYYVGLALTDPSGAVVTPWGAHNVLNEDYLYPQGAWGWKDCELYQLAATPGVAIHLPGSATDRTWVLTADVIPAGTEEFKSEFILIEAFIPTGLADLQQHIDDTREILIPYLDSLELFDQCPICGDCNADGVINSADIVYLINYLFKGGTEPKWPINRGDVNGDGIINSADVVSLINYLFKGGEAPRCLWM